MKHAVFQTTGGVMSDQADPLRQLVRAHNAWRELASEQESATLAANGLRTSRVSLSLACGQARRWAREQGLRLAAGRAARWALRLVRR